MPMMNWAQLLNSPTSVADGTALANSVTLTDINPSGAGGSWTVPANFDTNGSVFRLTAWGVFSTTSTPTLSLGFYLGGVAGAALLTTGAITTGTTLTNVPWLVEAIVVIRTTGATGSAKSRGRCEFGTSVSAISHLPMPNTADTSTVTIDTTTAKQFTVGAQWGTANASNTITCQHFLVESLGA